MRFPASVVAVLMALIVSGASMADEAVKKPLKAKDKIVNRLPSNFGKIGINDTQRKKIYSIQANYRSKIQALLKELKDMRAQQKAEIQSVLTDKQKTALKALLEASQKKRDANQKKK